MGSNLGFACWVVGDACAVFDRATAPGCPWEGGVVLPAELVHAVNLASLHGEFARVLNAEGLIEGLSGPEH